MGLKIRAMFLGHGWTLSASSISSVNDFDYLFVPLLHEWQLLSQAELIVPPVLETIYLRISYCIFSNRHEIFSFPHPKNN